MEGTAVTAREALLSAQNRSINVGKNEVFASVSGSPVKMECLTKSFGPITAVDDVSLNIAAGEFVSLLGPSGSGKTTILMMLAGFQLPDKGVIGVAGKDITTTAPYDRDIGMVFQSYALFPHMTVFDNVAYALRLRKLGTREIEERVRKALDIVRLPAEIYANRMPKQLSGGQCQRVALVRALVYEPRVLLMDEPMGALDKNLREELKLELIALQERLRLTILYVTHDQQEAMMLSDRVAVMRDGKIEQIDSPEKLYRRPRSEFVARFLGDANLLPIHCNGEGYFTLSNGLTLNTGLDAMASGVQEFLFMLRPEEIEPTSEIESNVSGQVVSTVYLGSSIRLEVNTPVGMLTVMTKSCAPVRFHSGDDVHLRLNLESPVLIPKNS